MMHDMLDNVLKKMCNDNEALFHLNQNNKHYNVIVTFYLVVKNGLNLLQ